MWPMLLDMSEEESVRNLRLLELEAYSGLVTALRAQGPLNQEKLKLLKETCTALHIPIDRHKAEVRRAVNDEKLNTIAYYASGQVTTLDEWVQESLRMIPLMPRMAPQTAYSVIADETADNTCITNKQLPLPACTERKRSSTHTSSIISDINKSVQFRLPENTKPDEVRKRRLPFCTENSSLAQHLISHPKVSRIQQIYRQRTKAKLKEQQLQMKIKQEQEQLDVVRSTQQQVNHPKFQYKQPLSPQSTANTSKVNILQNVSVSQNIAEEDTKELIKTENSVNEQNSVSSQPSCLNENQVLKSKQILTTVKCTQSALFNKPSVLPGTSGEVQKTYKVCSTRKPVTKAVTTGQKLIVVPSAQSISSNSILQHTLTIPFVKNISVKNFDKFKIVTSTTSASNFTGVITNSNNNSLTTSSVKHKVVTVRTNSASKKVIPISQLQLLNAKGSIKVLPIGGKIITKSTANTSSSLYIVNSSIQALTKSTSSTPVIMTCKMQENSNDNKPILFLKNHDLSNVVPTVEVDKTEKVKENPTDCSITSSEVQENSNGKSSILADILKASGVMPSDSEDVDNQVPPLLDVLSVASEIVSEDSEAINQSDNIETHDGEGHVEYTVDVDMESHTKEAHLECNETLSEMTNFDDSHENEFEEHSDTYFILQPQSQDGELVQCQNEEESAEISTIMTDENCVDNLSEQYSVEITSEPTCVDDNVKMEESIVLNLQNSDISDLNISN